MNMRRVFGYAVILMTLTTPSVRADDVCFSVPKIFFAYGFGNSITFPFSSLTTSVHLTK